MATYFIGSFGLGLAAIYGSSLWAIPLLLMPLVISKGLRSLRCPSCEEPVLFKSYLKILSPFFPTRCPHCEVNLKQRSEIQAFNDKQ